MVNPASKPQKRRGSRSSAKEGPGGVFKCVAALNVAEEKATFMQAHKRGESYEPQFKYPWSTAAHPYSERPECLRKHEDPSNEDLENAVRIIQTCLEKYGTYQEYEEKYGGAELDREGVRRVVNAYFVANNIKQMHLRFNSGMTSRGAMALGKHGPTLYLRPEGCREDWLRGTLDHEVGTHYLRLMNERRQPWHGRKGRRAYGCLDKNPTEEGIASLHTVLSRPGHCMWRAAMNYYAGFQAKSLGFYALFKDLSRFTDDLEERWDFTYRAKRGYEDTGAPGSFCKDQMYLEGALSILRERETIDFKALYMGQIALADLARLREGGDAEGIQIPSFMRDIEEYRAKLGAIAEANDIRL